MRWIQFNHCRRNAAAFLGLLLVFSAAFACADSGESVVAAQRSDTSAVVEKRLRAELRVLLMDMIQSGELKAEPDTPISINIEAGGERAADLGVLVDTRSGETAKPGLLVLGTTPGSLASTIGFRNGDVIVSLNGVKLSGLGSDRDGSALAGRVLRETLAPIEDGSPLSFGVVRNDERLTLAGSNRSLWIPPFSFHVGTAGSDAAEAGKPSASSLSGSDCGWINSFDNAPRQRQLHGAVLISIDGEHTPLRGRSSYRLTTGRHVLKVGELIEDRYLGFSQTFRDRGGADRYKTLVVDVAADTAYFLAARLNADHRNEWRDGRYWEPVIWNTEPENCR